MYLNTIVLWTLIGCIIIAEVRSIRFTSPQHLFSDEPDILDGYFHTSQNEHERTKRSTHQEETIHSRVRRQSRVRNNVPDPVITKSKPLCDHNRLIIRWTDTNLVSQTGAIIALCREDASSRTTRNNAAVFVSYDYGLNWKNVTDKFTQALGKKPTIDMYYTVAESPNFILFTDKVNKKIFYTNDAARTIHATSVVFAPSDVSINRGNPTIVVASSSTRNREGKIITRLYMSKDSGQTYTILRSYIDVKAYYWGSTEYGDKATDLFIEAKKSVGSVQGFKLDCSTGVTCGNPQTLTDGAPLNGDITDFLVKGPYMFVTQHNKGKTGVNLFVKYKRSGTFKMAKIITTSLLKEVFVYDVSGGQVMLVVNHRKNETNLYNSLDITGSNYSLSLPRVLYHNPNTEVSSHWLRNAVKYRFVDVWRVQGLPSVYFATQLTVGPVGGRYLISKMTFDKGGIWKKIKGPEKNKYGRPCHYPVCSLHVNLLYGSIYRYSKTTPLMSRKSAPGLLMATGVLGTNLKITPDTYLSRDGGNTFKMVLRGKRRFSFGDHGGFVLASDFQSSTQIQYSVDFENFNPVILPNTTRNVDIKTILTEPGEKGVIFLVIGLVNGFYHIFQVNATRSLGVPCTEKDFYKVNVTDIGVGGCAVQQVQLRNSSTQCLTGKNYKRVISITYSGCMCRRRHYQCDLQFMPDKRGSCVQMLPTSLIPSHCPEGTHFMQSRGYSKIPQYVSCTEDNETRRTLSAVRTPCPVEVLRLDEVKTLPKMKNNMVRIAHGRPLHFKVALKNGYLPHINFTYVFDDYNVNGIGENYSSRILKMNKTGSFVLLIKVSNPKSFIQYSINVNVIRPLNATMMKLTMYPEEPSIKEKTAFMLQMPDGIDP
ncbi:Sortilin-related receptor, partial [Paramuricea clavata]